MRLACLNLDDGKTFSQASGTNHPLALLLEVKTTDSCGSQNDKLKNSDTTKKRLRGLRRKDDERPDNEERENSQQAHEPYIPGGSSLRLLCVAHFCRTVLFALAALHGLSRDEACEHGAAGFDGRFSGVCIGAMRGGGEASSKSGGVRKVERVGGRSEK